MGEKIGKDLWVDWVDKIKEKIFIFCGRWGLDLCYFIRTKANQSYLTLSDHSNLFSNPTIIPKAHLIESIMEISTRVVSNNFLKKNQAFPPHLESSLSTSNILDVTDIKIFSDAIISGVGIIANETNDL